MDLSFWESREQVERFAAREPDVRLVELVDRLSELSATRVLDLGCAGGRNAVFLARRGFDIHAVDSSRAMVAETRTRLAAVLGEGEARRRVRLGRMDRLAFKTASFDLVVALGIYHQAQTEEEWRRALLESARVSNPGAFLLVSVFTPETDLTGRGIQRVAADAHVYEGFPGGGRVTLVDADTLDRDVSAAGFAPAVPSRIVRREAGPERRVSVNALYVRTTAEETPG
jgi:SAM-dependent methyltransferase